MNSQPINHRLPYRKSGVFSARAAFIAFALLAVAAVPSLKAQTAAVTGSCQTAIENYLTAHSEGTILTSSSTALANAVAEVIKANTNAALTPYDFAVSAVLPYPYGTNGSTGSVRTDVSPSFNRDAAAIRVSGSAIAQVIATGTTPTITAVTFQNDIALIAQDVVDVSGTNTAKNLTTAGREGVLANTLTLLDNSYNPASAGLKPFVLASATALGEKLLADSYLESLPSDGLLTIAKNALNTTGTYTAFAPTIANDFVVGLVTSSSNTFTWPDKAEGVTSAQFAVNILTYVQGNATSDVLIIHALSTRVYDNNSANQATLVALGNALFVAWPSSRPVVEIALSQGLIAGVTQGVDQENLRVNFIKAFTTNQIASVPNIEEGAIYTDPYYAGAFTTGIFATVKASASGSATLIADAPIIATDAGTVLGADGNVLTQVASVFGTYIGNGSLSGTAAGTYATDMIEAAHTSTVTAFGADAWGNGGGGHLVTAQGLITTATVMDLASITDVLAGGIRTHYATLGTLNTTGASAFASQVGTVAEDVAKIITTETFNGNTNTGNSGLVAEYIAATLADYIVALNVGSSAQADALADIKTDVDAAVNNSTDNTAINNAVNEAVTHNNGYGDIAGPISVQETTVTDF